MATMTRRTQSNTADNAGAAATAAGTTGARTTRARTRRGPTRSEKFRGPLIARILIGIGLLIAVVIQLVPFYTSLTSSLKFKTDLSSQWTVPLFDATLTNYGTAIVDGHILTAIWNSVIITGVSTTLVCLIGAITAYPLARRTTRGNAGIMAGFIGMMMIPPLSTLVPLYVTMMELGLLDSRFGLIMVMISGNLPLAVFLYAAFMRSLPLAIEEAASVDGAGPITILFRIVFPMLKPVTATVAILVSVGVWNEFALSGYFLQSKDKMTIAPTVANFFGSNSSNLGAAAAAALLSVVPILIAYLFLQKYFIKGMIAGSQK